MYTALVLTEKSRERLLTECYVPARWEEIAHHMTIHLGRVQEGTGVTLDRVYRMKVTHIGRLDGKVMAVKVETECPSANKIKHITLGVNRKAGGKPVMSNDITEWEPFKEIELTGIVEECP